MSKIEDFGFYTIDIDYLEYLYNGDKEVYYNKRYDTSIKPFVGIIILLEGYNYFIPLTSVKEKHKKFRNVTNEHFLIYEIVKNIDNIDGVYKYFSKEEKMHILALLDIKKMIPVPKSLYNKVEFSTILDKKYKLLFQKEYEFCLNIKEKILEKAVKLYEEQKFTGIVRKMNCNFSKLEQMMLRYKK